MIAGNRRMPEQEPGDIEALLPWHAAGTLDARDSRRVAEALERGDFRRLPGGVSFVPPMSLVSGSARLRARSAARVRRWWRRY